MKNKKILEFIKNTNQVFLFLGVSIGIILFIISMSIIFINDIFNNHNKVKIIKNTDNTKKLKTIIKEDLDFSLYFNDVYIFEVKSDFINENSQDLKELRKEFESSSGYNSKPIINILFVNKMNKETYYLFDRNILINKVYYSNLEEYQKHDYTSNLKNYNLYEIIEYDSNKDGYLSYEDNINLYISDFNGEKNKLILKNINDVRIISKTEVLVSTINNTYTNYFIYNTDTHSLEKLVSNKKIN